MKVTGSIPVEEVRRQYRADRLQTLPRCEYDLAISYLVAQHMSDATLGEQIRHIVRALKPSGIFALHMSFDLNGKAWPDTSSNQKAGAVHRSQTDFTAMVRSAGGAIALEREFTRFSDLGCFWVAYHIKPSGH